LIYSGHLPGLPSGWLIKRLQRTGDRREGRIDTVIYSEMVRRVKSMVEAHNYHEMLKAGSDEKAAYRNRRRRVNSVKGKSITQRALVTSPIVTDPLHRRPKNPNEQRKWYQEITHAPAQEHLIIHKRKTSD